MVTCLKFLLSIFNTASSFSQYTPMAMALFAQILLLTSPFPSPTIRGEVISLRSTVATDTKLYLLYAMAHENASYFPAPSFAVFCHHPGGNREFVFGDFKDFFVSLR